MQAFLDKAFEEVCLEALEECEEQKEVYRIRMEAYFEQAAGQKFKHHVTMEKMQTLFGYIVKGITAENMSQDTMQPELMYIRICEYIDMMRGVYDEV